MVDRPTDNPNFALHTSLDYLNTILANGKQSGQRGRYNYGLLRRLRAGNQVDSY
jgi:hypothetical protein